MKDVTFLAALAAAYHFVGERTGTPAQLSDQQDPDVTRAVLRSARGYPTSRSMSSRHVQTQATYPWDYLVALYGTEDALRAAVGALRGVDGESDLVQLAERYLSGWRHKSITDPDD